MIRLLSIEFRKIMPYRMFWVMAGMYLLSMAFIFYGFPSLIDYFSMRSDAPEVKLIKNFLYNFPDIWQNLAWIAGLRYFIKVLLGMIMVVLITNEYTYTTIRHNIINGLSRTDFLLGKIYLILFISLVSTLLILVSGLILGLSFSSVTTLQAMSGKLIFLLGYFIEVATYLLFALMLGLLVKRTGLAIIFLFISFSPYRKFRLALEHEDFGRAGAKLGLIRTLILVNLLLGITAALAGSAGRFAVAVVP